MLPTGVLPLTSVVTAIGAGDRDRLLVRYGDGREEKRPLTAIADYVTEARNPGNHLGVELARVELEHELLLPGLELVDTPGIGSIHTHTAAAARDFLSRIDAAICVLDAGQPLSQAERDLLLEVGGSRAACAVSAQRKGVAGAGGIPAAIAEQVLAALSALLVYAFAGRGGWLAALERLTIGG